MLEFCRNLAQRQPGLQWIAQMRADALDDEVAAEMAAAGCRRIYFGVESGSEAVLRRVRKGTDRESIRLGIESAKKAGIRVKTGWVFGLPGTIDEQYESVAFMRELHPHEISIHQLIPFPGTEYYAHPERYGIRIRDPKDFASFCYGGMGDNVSFDYLSQGQLIELLRVHGRCLAVRRIHQQRPGNRRNPVRFLHAAQFDVDERIPHGKTQMQ